MTIYKIANWADGEVCTETVITEIGAYSRKRGDRYVTLVGLVDPGTAEAIRCALIDEVTALNPTSTFAVESDARVVVDVVAYSAPAADGSRRPARAGQSLPLTATEGEVESIAEALRKKVAAQLELLAARGSVAA